MRLTTVNIEGFRSIKKAVIELDLLTPVVGYNNAGKSNILSSIQWLLKPFALENTDFNSPASSVVVAAKIEGLSAEIVSEMAENHRKSISPYISSEMLRVRRSMAQPGAVSTAVLQVRDPKIADESSEEAWKPNPSGIDNALKVLFPEPIRINAMEDAAEDASKQSKSSTIGKLIARIVEPIQKQHGKELESALNDIGTRLSAEGSKRAAELVEFDTKANDNLKDLFPGLNVRVHIPPPQIGDLFKTGTLRVYEGDPTAVEGRDLSCLGHGAQRCIQMALIRYMAEIAATKSKAPFRTLLLIDEPELYLHPQGIEQVRIALKKLSKGNFQVVFSTHSPLMIKAEDVASALIVRKTSANGTVVPPPAKTLILKTLQDHAAQRNLLFEIGSSSEILFSDSVLLLEGSTEKNLVPKSIEAITRSTLAALKTGLVPIGGSGNTAHCLSILKSLDIKGKAVVDLDYAFRQGIKSGVLDSNDADVAACKTWFRNNHAAHGIDLEADGFPTKRGKVTAEAAYQILAKDASMTAHIEALHNRLLPSNIFLLKQGAIEAYYNLTAKGDHTAMDTIRRRLESEDPDAVIPGVVGIRELTQWVLN